MYDKAKELDEAIAAGERALSALHRADRSLSGAGSWGVVDMLGGSLLSGLRKHSKVNDAGRSVEEAKEALRSFRTELDDVQDIQGLDLGVGDLLTFADFFFDGFIVDAMVQSRIAEAQNKVRRAESRVRQILEKLRAERDAG